MNTFFVIFAGLGSMVALAAGFLWLNDRYMNGRNRDRRTPEQKTQEEAILVARLENPKWDEVERVTGGRPSPALVALYADIALLRQKDWLYIVNPAPGVDKLPEECISFRHADNIALGDEWCQHLPKNAFPFASDFLGDLLFVELNASGEDFPVMHWFHDGGDIEMVAPSLAAFLSWKRSDTPLPE